jgi:hypothetical protein
MCSCGSNRPTPGSPGCPPGGTSPTAPSQQCPSTCACGTTRWIDTQAYCGDSARLEANLNGNCPDGPATFEILHPTDGSVVATINARMTGRHVAATWITKAQTANWRTDRHRFRVTAAGVTCTSSNEFTFRQRPVTALLPTDAPFPCGGAGGVDRMLWDTTLEASRVHQSLKLKSRRGRRATAAIKTAFELRVKTQAETVWNDGFNNKKFHRRNCQRLEACDCPFDCCKAGFHFTLNFVASGEHYRIKIIGDPNPARPRLTSLTRYNDSEWGYPPRAPDTTYAHETGHLLGHYDEYVTACPDPAAAGTLYRQPAPVPAAEHNLMSHAGNTTLYNRHYRRMLEFLNTNAGGDPYDIIPSGP